MPDAFKAFHIKWILRPYDFSVEAYSGEQPFECTLNYGQPWNAYVSIDALGKIWKYDDCQEACQARPLLNRSKEALK